MNINIYNPYVRKELELYHHGIFGQRWGKKNGPPYPLGASDHSASEKKAGWRKSLDGGGQTRREARKYTKAMNQIDKDIAEYTARKQRASDIANKATHKEAQALKYGAGSKQFNKAHEKSAKLHRIADAWEKKQLEAEHKMMSIMDEYESKGYTCESVPIKRMALQGESLTAQVLGGVLANAVVSFNNRKYILQDGYKHKVKIGNGKEDLYKKYPFEESETGKKLHEAFEKTVNKADSNATSNSEGALVYTEKQRQDKVTRAKNDDMWDIEFLERYNPEGPDGPAEWNQQHALKEYKNYLKDPYNYHFNGEITNARTSRSKSKSSSATNNFLNLSSKDKQIAMDRARRVPTIDYRRARQMFNSGRSYEEIAKRLGVSESTVWAMLSDEG